MTKRRTGPALIRLNLDLPMEAIEGAVEEISRDFFERFSVFSGHFTGW